MLNNGMTDEEFVRTVNHGRRSKMAGIMVVLYDHPKDFPDSYVARAHFVGRGRHWPSSEIFIVRDTLAEVQAAIPGGMVKLNRSSADDPHIIEMYL